MSKIIFNDYGKRPFIESLLKELQFIFVIIGKTILLQKKTYLLCYPQLPSKKTTLAKIAKRNRWIISNNPKIKASIKIYWHDSSIDNTNYPIDLRDYLNNNCRDILKANVDHHFYNAFGYKTAIQAETHQGKAVEKSEYNAKHNGTIVECPLPQSKINKECIYQILINNCCDNNLYEDLRMPVINGSFPLVYRKLKSDAKRFEASPDKAILHQPKDFFDDSFLAKTREFCKQAGLQFGEMDILYNRDDKKYYIIDINKTPYGPPKNLSPEDHQKAIKLLADEMKKQN